MVEWLRQRPGFCSGSSKDFTVILEKSFKPIFFKMHVHTLYLQNTRYTHDIKGCMQRNACVQIPDVQAICAHATLTFTCVWVTFASFGVAQKEVCFFFCASTCDNSSVPQFSHR